MRAYKCSPFRLCCLSLISSFLLASCGSSNEAPSLQSTSSLQGSWKLTNIKCGGQESTFLSSQVLVGGALPDGTPIVSQFELKDTSGHRLWKIAGCEVKVPITGVALSSPTALRFDEQPTECSASCAGTNICTPTPAYPATEYPIAQTGTELQVTLPEAVKTRTVPLPCGAGQSTDSVVLVYQKL